MGGVVIVDGVVDAVASVESFVALFSARATSSSQECARSGVFAPSKTFARGSTVRLHPPRHSSKLFGPLIRHSPGPQQGG